MRFVSPGVSPEKVIGKLVNPVTKPTGWMGMGPPRVIAPGPIDQIRANYPDLTIEFAGRQQQMADAFGSLPLGFLAASVMIYVILAWLFGSYTQPLVVMFVVPFSLVGVVWGHLLLGYDLTFLSLIGFVALSGIVVNDSLILVEFYNKMRDKGMPVRDALVAAGAEAGDAESLVVLLCAGAGSVNAIAPTIDNAARRTSGEQNRLSRAPSGRDAWSDVIARNYRSADRPANFTPTRN